MASFYESARLYTSKIQKALGTQFLIFYAFDNNQNKRGIFVVDLGSLPTLDPNDQQGLANAIKQNMKKLVFANDNDPAVDELALDGHGHIMFDVNGNDNLLCIGWGHEVSSRNYVVTLAGSKKRSGH